MVPGQGSRPGTCRRAPPPPKITRPRGVLAALPVLPQEVCCSRTPSEAHLPTALPGRAVTAPAQPAEVTSAHAGGHLHRHPLGRVAPASGRPWALRTLEHRVLRRGDPFTPASWALSDLCPVLISAEPRVAGRPAPDASKATPANGQRHRAQPARSQRSPQPKVLRSTLHPSRAAGWVAAPLSATKNAGSPVTAGVRKAASLTRYPAAPTVIGLDACRRTGRFAHRWR